MDRNKSPYMFSAFCDCSEDALMCKKCFKNTLATPKKIYAQAYVVPTSYTNMVCPDKALERGTCFNDLYMPYVPSAVRREDNQNECNC